MGESVKTSQYVYVKGIKLSEVGQLAEQLQAERGNTDPIFFRMEPDGTLTEYNPDDLQIQVLTEKRVIMDDVQEGGSGKTSA